MNDKDLIILLLTIVGFLITAFVGYYVIDTKNKFKDLQEAISELKSNVDELILAVGMRKQYRQNHQGG